jgi:hypothetical protein
LHLPVEGPGSSQRHPALQIQKFTGHRGGPDIEGYSQKGVFPRRLYPPDHLPIAHHIEFHPEIGAHKTRQFYQRGAIPKSEPLHHLLQGRDFRESGLLHPQPDTVHRKLLYPDLPGFGEDQRRSGEGVANLTLQVSQNYRLTGQAKPFL